MERTPGDTTTPHPARPRPEQAQRDDRLKAALKANMARRKAQARVRNGQDAIATDEEEAS